MNENIEVLDIDPVAHIEHVRSRIHPMGRNDHEHSTLDKIIEDYKSGLISGEEAIKRADDLLNTKQDYN